MCLYSLGTADRDKGFKFTIKAHAEQHSAGVQVCLCLVLTWDVQTLFSVTLTYSSSSNERGKIEKVIMGALRGISLHIERLNFLLHICFHCCELKLIWMERLKHTFSTRSVSHTFLMKQLQVVHHGEITGYAPLWLQAQGGS